MSLNTNAYYCAAAVALCKPMFMAAPLAQLLNGIDVLCCSDAAGMVRVADAYRKRGRGRDDDDGEWAPPRRPGRYPSGLKRRSGTHSPNISRSWGQGQSHWARC